MDEQTQAVETRRRRSSAEVEQLVAEYERSGLGRTEFCRQHQLSLSTLARYRKRQTETNAVAVAESRWLTVEVAGGGAPLGSGASSGLAVALGGGRRVEIGRGFDAATLIRLLGVLERA